MRYLIGLVFVAQTALAQWPVVTLNVKQSRWKFFSNNTRLIVPVISGRRILVPTKIVKDSESLTILVKNGASESRITLNRVVKNEKKSNDKDNKKEPFFTTFNLPSTLGDVKEADVVDVNLGDRLLVITYDGDLLVAHGGVVSAKTGEGILTDAVSPDVQGVAITPEGGLVGLVSPPPDDIKTSLAYIRILPDIKEVAMN